MKYVHFSDTGEILGWYDDNVHTTIPTPNEQVEEALWEEAVSNGYNFFDTVNLVASHKDLRSLSKAVEEKLIEIEQEYNNANYLDIDYMGTTFQAGPLSQDILTKALVVGSVPDGFFWLDAFNSQIFMTFQELQGLGATILLRGQLNFIRKQELKAMVSSSTTVEEIVNIVCSF